MKPAQIPMERTAVIWLNIIWFPLEADSENSEKIGEDLSECLDPKTPWSDIISGGISFVSSKSSTG